MYQAKITPFGLGECPHLEDVERRSFEVTIPGTGCSLWAFEGFVLDHEDSEMGREIRRTDLLIEHDILEIAHIKVEAEVMGKGLGRLLLRAATQEAHRRDIDRIRLTVHNARILSNLEILEQESTIRAVQLFLGHGSDVIPSTWLPALTQLITYEKGRRYLNENLENPVGNGYSENYVTALAQAA